MKLIFKENYLSMTTFDPFYLEDFSILTGLNGSGKTHLLKAISSGAIEIEGIDKSEIVYYNYNDFTVSTKMADEKLLNERKTMLNNKTNIILKKFDELKKQTLEVFISKLNPFDKFLYNLKNHPNASIITGINVSKNYENLEKIKNEDDIKNKLPQYASMFNKEFYSFIFQYINEFNGNVKELTRDYLLSKLKIINSEFDSFFNKENSDYCEFYKIGLGKGIILNIQQSDFELPDFFLQEIANEEKGYQMLFANDSYNKALNTDRGLNIKYLGKDSFIEKYGKSPVEQINDVLLEYDCNGYFLTNNNYTVPLGVDIKDIKVPIELIHKENGYRTSFDKLSSGEKTLIALTLLIYKSQKNKILPRVLLLDEIDSSLHPSMVKILLEVLKNLFVKKRNIKIVIVSHSPTTIALAPKDSLYIVKRENNNIVKKVEKNFAIDFLTEGFATINEEDTHFGINYNIAKTDLPVVFTEGITDKIILETAWTKVYDTEMPFFIQDCFDASFLGNLFRRAEDTKDGIFSNYPDKTFIALFDFDEEGYNVWNRLKKFYTLIEEEPRKALTIKHNTKCAYALLLPVPENIDIIKQVIKSGKETFKNESILPIELLFYGIESLNHYYKKEPIKGGGEVIVFTGKKRDFAISLNHLKKEDFKNVIPIFDKINEIIRSNAR